ncbi:hypothetical protein Tco_1404122 [Tanacetum coccineum]
MITNTNVLRVKVIKALHGQEGGFGLNAISSNAILPSDSIRFCVGCGSSTRFWKDLWTCTSHLYLRFDRLFRLDRDKDCIVQNRFKDNQWTWNWSRSFMGARNNAHLYDMINDISPIEISTDHDVSIWTLANDDRLPHRLNLSSCGIDIPSIGYPLCDANV